MDKSVTIIAVAAVGAYAFAPRGAARSTPPPGANAAAQAVRATMGASVCGIAATPAANAGPLGIFGAQLRALTAAHGRRLGLTRGYHVYPDRLPLDCAVAWGEVWRLCYLAWLTAALAEGAQGTPAVTRAVNLLTDRLVALQRIAGRPVSSDALDRFAGVVPLSKVFANVGLAGSESAPLVRFAVDNLVDAIRLLSVEMENVYDAAATADPDNDRGYWSIFNDKLASNVLAPASDVVAGIGGGALEVLFGAAAQLVLSPVGAAGAAYLAWRYLT